MTQLGMLKVGTMYLGEHQVKVIIDTAGRGGKGETYVSYDDLVKQNLILNYHEEEKDDGSNTTGRET